MSKKYIYRQIHIGDTFLIVVRVRVAPFVKTPAKQLFGKGPDRHHGTVMMMRKKYAQDVCHYIKRMQELYRIDVLKERYLGTECNILEYMHERSPKNRKKRNVSLSIPFICEIPEQQIGKSLFLLPQYLKSLLPPIFKAQLKKRSPPVARSG